MNTRERTGWPEIDALTEVYDAEVGKGRRIQETSLAATAAAAVRRAQLVADSDAAYARIDAAWARLTRATSGGDQDAIAAARAHVDQVQREAERVGRDCRAGLVELLEEIGARQVAIYAQLEVTNAAGDAIHDAFARRRAELTAAPGAREA